MKFVEKKSIAVQIAQAISFLHSTSPLTVHLDVKPANILVKITLESAKMDRTFFFMQLESTTYHVYLADFGVSKVLSGTIATVNTSSKAGIGTPGFQPVEQLQAGKITESVDVYALWCVFYELFGEKRVWEGLSAMQILVKVVMEGKIPDTSHLPAYSKILVDMCLAKNRATSVQVLEKTLKLSQ